MFKRGRERESLEWVLCCLDEASNVSSLSRCCILMLYYECDVCCVCVCEREREGERKP